MSKQILAVGVTLAILFIVVPIIIYLFADMYGLAVYSGTLASFFTPFMAIVFISTRTKHGELLQISTSLDAYADRDNPNIEEDNKAVIDDGTRFAIYSHYLGFSTQIITGFVSMLVLASFLPNNPPSLIIICVYVMTASAATWVGAHKLSPWDLYRNLPSKWYSGKYGLPPLKAPLNMMRLFLFIFAIVSICYIGCAVPNETPDVPPQTVSQDASSITTP